MKKRARMPLNRETLRCLNDDRMRQAGGELTGTYSVTCPDRTCGNCVTGALTSCRCTPAV
jgi:hypothetical protein